MRRGTPGHWAEIGMVTGGRILVERKMRRKRREGTSGEIRDTSEGGKN